MAENSIQKPPPRYSYEGCPDGAYSPEDLEVILELATDLYCFGFRTVLKLQAVMNRGLKEGMFDRINGRIPAYLPDPVEGFSYEFCKWAFERVRLRIQRRIPKRPEEFLEEDLGTLQAIESSVLQQILRHQSARGNAGIHLSAVQTYLGLLERRHKMLGLDMTTLVLQDKAKDTVVGKILKEIMERHPSSKNATRFYGGAENAEQLPAEEQAMALLDSRDGYGTTEPNEPTEPAEPKPDAGGASGESPQPQDGAGGGEVANTP